ncbi:aldo/keto reductase [Nesterenkonia xinjiangensis]|uniref:Aryl-alcohol dehydrogenase-like predicted oxidoreductase n=1 Tax=Nesterenkonia xinjiangensis TaxID=225327 RepID=A0A7Z0GJT0_9MICC|nr:aldo/keto reductase [Nesterenkonia xinjiangensis]NYJ77247.1 aryl-alcohol dehydrogenase-like predicted oxidoreductase [Nesterenkonia xinjiangensis]
MDTAFHRPLSATCGLRVSPLALGTLPFGGAHGMEHMGDLDARGAAALLDRGAEAGINLVDTANFYSLGVAEEILGEALRISDHGDSWLVTTKARLAVGEGPNDAGASRWHLLQQVEQSLRRIGRDHIDLFYLHHWDGETPLEETLQTMDGLVRSGKIRYYGVSNYTGWQLMKALMVCERHGFIKPVVQQIHYSPSAREAEYEMIPAASDQGIGTQAWSPLGMGLLTGKHRRGTSPEGGTRMTDGDGSDLRVADWGTLYDVVEALDEVAAGLGATIPQVVLAWLLQRPGVTNLAVAARSMEQWEDLLGSLHLELGEEEHARIEEAARPGIAYPFWHQADMASERITEGERSIVEAMQAQLG